MSKLEGLKSAIWRIYFIAGGYTSLIVWNFILNLTEYLACVFPHFSFTLVAFSFCFGSILAFLTASFLLGKLRHRGFINFCLFSMLLFYVLGFLSCEATSKELLNFSFAITSFFLTGFFNAALQGRLAGMSAYLSKREIVFFNFGTGLAGIASNIFAWMIERVLFSVEGRGSLSTLRWEVLCYGIIVFLTGVFFVFLQVLFDFAFPQVLSVESDKQIVSVLKLEPKSRGYNEKEERALLVADSNQPGSIPIKRKHSFPDVSKTYTRMGIINESLDLLYGISYLYICTIVVVAYFNLKAFFAFDKENNKFTIPAYLFFYNTMDTVGKFLPPGLLIGSSFLMHVLNGIRTLIPLHFVAILYFGLGGAWKSAFARAASNLILGFTNGYFTNSIIGLITDRFKKKKDKSQAAYFAILFLYVGIVFGTFLNILFDKL